MQIMVISSNQPDIDAVTILKIRHSPLRVELTHLKDIDSNTGIRFLASSDTRKLIMETLKKKKNNCRYSKSDLKKFNNKIDTSYAVIKQDDKIYMIYEGVKKKHHSGVGNFGVVKYAQNIITGEWIALKNISSKHVTDKNEPRLRTKSEINENSKSEIKKLSTAGKLLGSFKRESASKGFQVGILMPIADGDDLSDFKNKIVAGKYKLHPIQLLQIIIQMCDEVIKLHKTELIHRDIKIENYNIDIATGKIRLTDLGLSCPLPNNGVYHSKYIAGSYRLNTPPETYHGNYSIKSDAYGLGIAITDLLDLLDYPENENERYRLTSKDNPKYLNNEIIKDLSLRKELYRCLENLTDDNVKSRLTPEDAINIFRSMQKKYLDIKQDKIKVGILDIDEFIAANTLTRIAMQTQMKSCQKVFLVSTSKCIPTELDDIIRMFEKHNIMHSDKIYCANNTNKLSLLIPHILENSATSDDNIYAHGDFFSISSTGMNALTSDENLNSSFDLLSTQKFLDTLKSCFISTPAWTTLFERSINGIAPPAPPKVPDITSAIASLGLKINMMKSANTSVNITTLLPTLIKIINFLSDKKGADKIIDSMIKVISNSINSDEITPDIVTASLSTLEPEIKNFRKFKNYFESRIGEHVTSGSSIKFKL